MHFKASNIKIYVVQNPHSRFPVKAWGNREKILGNQLKSFIILLKILGNRHGNRSYWIWIWSSCHVNILLKMLLSLNFSYSCKQKYEIRLRRFLQWETAFLTEHSVKVLINEWNKITMNRNLSKCKICFANINKLNNITKSPCRT